MNKNRISTLFGIRYPIIPAGQVVKEMIEGYHRTLKKLSDETF